MKSPLSRKQFFAALAAVVLVFASHTPARAQTKRGKTVIAPPVVTQPTPKPTPRDIPFGTPRSVETGPIKWQEFKSETGGFSVKFPGEPQIKEAPLNKGPVAMTRRIHTATFGGMAFEVDYVNMPAGYDDPELSLEGGISGMTHAMEGRGARVLTREKVVRGTCEGRDATLLLPNPAPRKDGFAEGRIFNSGQRYYFLMFVGEEDGPSVREAVRTFMDSFTVTDGCTSAVAPVTAPSGRKTVSHVEGTPDAATGWRRIENTELGFSVLMPGVAEHESEQAQVEPFPITHHTYTQEDDSAIYSAEVFGEYPPNFHGTPGSYQAMIDVTLYAMKRNFEPSGFVLAPLRDMKVGTYPGREFSLTNEKLGVKGRAQIYVTPKRIYVFAALIRGKVAAATTLERFFSSVQVSPK